MGGVAAFGCSGSGTPGYGSMPEYVVRPAGRVESSLVQIGLHRVMVVEVDGMRRRVRNLEALDGTRCWT